TLKFGHFSPIIHQTHVDPHSFVTLRTGAREGVRRGCPIDDEGTPDGDD
ncbi:MAG: hypothetical protein RIS52_2219, partial [Pseudomonadota bacterium]